MDSSNRVIIDSTPFRGGGVLQAVRVHLCCTSTTQLQIWLRINVDGQDDEVLRYQLMWQMNVTASLSQVISAKYAVVSYKLNTQ